jgi:hypothetical protein
MWREKSGGVAFAYIGLLMLCLPTAIRLIKLSPGNRYIEDDLLADVRARSAFGKVVGKVNLPGFNH